MSRRSFGVEFRDPDAPTLTSPYATLMEQLGELVDEVSAAEVRVSMAQAARARRIEAARAWAVEAALAIPRGALPGDGPRGGELLGEDRQRRIDWAQRSFTAEIASSLRLSDGAARNLVWASQTLVNLLPLTLQSLADGGIGYRHAQTLIDQATLLDAESLAMLEQKVLARGVHQTPGQFERTVRAFVERLRTDDMVVRQVEAYEKRNFYTEPMRDGMMRLVLEASAVQVEAIDNFVTARAKALVSDAESRTLPQLRVDVLCDLALDIDGRVRELTSTAGVGDGQVARFRSIRPTVLVTVPALTVLRQRDEPGDLEDFGPIDPQTARELTANAPSMIRILTHPDTGAALSIGRKRYRIPRKMRMFLRFRDGICRFPGCGRMASNCDLDHNREWATEGGETAHYNLAHLCRWHHSLKGNTGWDVRQDPNGSGALTWTSPTGHIYRTAPRRTVTPHDGSQGSR
jgi:hypothetical protein